MDVAAHAQALREGEQYVLHSSENFDDRVFTFLLVCVRQIPLAAMALFSFTVRILRSMSHEMAGLAQVR